MPLCAAAGFERLARSCVGAGNTVTRANGLQMSAKLLKGGHFCWFDHGTFLDAFDLLNDFASQLLSAISRTSEHLHVFSPPEA